MQYNALIEESLCYKTIRALYRYFLVSTFFRIVKGSASIMSGMFKEAILGSESRRLFISSLTACRGNTLYFILASIFSILVCHISLGLLVFGKIKYMPMLLFCIALFAIYLVKKGAIKYAASVYRDSYTFRLVNKKI